jgi:hypothetical protein
MAEPVCNSPSDQEYWRSRLAAAEQDYHRLSDELQQVLRDQANCGLPPDRDPAVLAARERKTAARVEYLRILRIFTDLVLRGKVPPDAR